MKVFFGVFLQHHHPTEKTVTLQQCFIVYSDIMEVDFIEIMYFKGWPQWSRLDRGLCM